MSFIDSLNNFLNKSRINSGMMKREITDLEISFMGYAVGHDSDISTFSQTFKYKYNLDYKSTIDFLINYDYLRIGTPAESISLYTISEIKKCLKRYNLPTSGSKEVLVQRVISDVPDYQFAFTKRILSATDLGKRTFDEYNSRRICEVKSKVSKTIDSIKNNQYKNIAGLWENEKESKNPLAIPYDNTSVLNDMHAIYEYYKNCSLSDRELAICIVSLMFHLEYKGIKNALIEMGYCDIEKEELLTISNYAYTYRSLFEFQDARIPKYKITSCRDERVCETCKMHDGKIYFTNKAVIGKNAPPFCRECRCLISPVFK